MTNIKMLYVELTGPKAFENSYIEFRKVVF